MNIATEIILAISVFVIVGFLARRYTRGLKTLMGLEAELLFGAEFIMLGVLLGPHGVRLFPPQALVDLTPVFYLALGWIGLSMTLELDFRTARRISSNLLGKSLLETAICFTFLFIFFVIFFRFTSTSADPKTWPLVLAVLSVPVAPAIIGAELRNYQVKNRALKDLFTLSVLDDLFALLFYLFIFPVIVWLHDDTGFFYKAIFSVVSGVFTGFMLHVLTITSRRRAEIFLILLGAVLMGTGLAGMLAVSPIIVCGIAGLVVANSSLKKVRMLEILHKAESPIFVLFLILVGARIDFDSLIGGGMLLEIVGVAFLFIFVRSAGKFSGSRISFKVFDRQRTEWGWALLGQGGTFVAILVDMHLAVPRVVGTDLVAIGIISFLINVFTVRPILRKVFTEHGERRYV